MGEYETLAARAKKKDVDAFAMLYELVYEDMYRMAFYMLGNGEDAQDVVSETVLAAFESIHKLRKASVFRSWIFKILINQCKKRRKTNAMKTLSTEALREKAFENNEEVGRDLEEFSQIAVKETISKEEAMDVKQAFLQLEEESRIIIAMSVFGGYSSEEIGKYLKMNANTVRTKRSRALGKLQDELSGNEKKTMKTCGTWRKNNE